MKTSDLRKLIKKIRKKTWLVLLAFALFLVYVLFDQRGLIQRLRLAGEKATIENKIEKLRTENARMQTEINKLQSSDKEIERIAREKYFMHRNGEKVIKVEPK